MKLEPSYLFLYIICAFVEEELFSILGHFLEPLNRPGVLEEIHKLINSLRPVNILLNRF